MPIIQSNVEQAVRMCLNQVDTCTVPGKPVLEDTLNTCLDSTVQMLRCSALRIDLTQEEIEEFTRQVREVIGIHQNDGHMIQESSPITYWFSDYLDRDYYFTNNPDANKENWISIEKSRTFYWNRYRKYLLDSGDFPLPVVNKLDKGTLLDLMNALGDPNSTESFFRKGLVVGDVQSGKTATYTGLVCKAADAGYKAIVILTGTIEDLRAQTQQRMEEGFIGIDIQAQMERRINDVRVGVGQRKYDFDIRYRPNDIHSFTSRKNDFKQPNGVERIGPGKIFFFVIKKQRDVLDNLYSWLSLNVNEQNHKIPYSLLLIDDEADNASINTLKEGQTRQNNVNNEVEDATSINYRIRKLADLFDKTTYVGFTATPFANVFIQPENDDDMAHVDLFPSDFIYSLEAPDNYIGAKRIFITHNDNDEEIIPEYYSSLTPITDAGNTVGDGWPFYYKHRIDWDGEVPDSLTDSILCFYLANAIRNYRGDTTCASTMMINMSRFANVQKRIRDKIAPVITDISNSIEYNLNINCPDDYTDPMLVRLKEIWNEQYEENRNTGARQRRATEKNPKRGNHDTLEWKDIVPHLRDANKNIEIRTINNQSTEKLNYDRYERENKRGLRVIAIGGLTLSRGLTLKNLVVTYFYRNTSTYDVLMQMGRWFGYRRNYEDIFRIWMGTQSIGWYGEIADAAEELKDAIRRMQEHELRPIDYGMRVRKVSSELQITAANKMRTAQTIVEWVNFTGTIIDTPYLYKDEDKNRRNIELAIEKFSVKYEDSQLTRYGNNYCYTNIPKNVIIDFLSHLLISPYNTKFHDDGNGIISSIANTQTVLDKWDVAFVSGDGDVEYIIPGTDRRCRTVSRMCYVQEDNRISVGKKGRMIGAEHGKIGLDTTNPETVVKIRTAEEKAREEFNRNNPGDEWRGNYSADTWFKYIKERKPLLLIYPITPKEITVEQIEVTPADRDYINSLRQNQTILLGIAVGIPSDGRDIAHCLRYANNQVYTRQQMGEFERDNDDSDN